ncbi:hypothetical protein [Brevibacillus choshinensis]|uniref:DUF2892 domain-containing protein n=1 Tax=Brevibacillus choshinensis TaxID=54911 RepID=A0ABX7FH45_BRECH|nr:hypothetical protein [Brevibacillus choshinensis]QRG65521.1 hypothetical protein JNE38_18050 [Brevibacillus choshinensis]
MSLRRALGMLSVAVGAICLIQTNSELSISTNAILIVLTIVLILVGLHFFEQ